MKIALINGSPKVNKSSSGALLEDLKYYLNGKTEIVECEMHVNSAYEKVLDELNTAEAWVFAYPLYVDGIPGHLLSFLAWLEEKGVKNGYVMWPVRTAVSGKQMTPAGATEIMEILGKEESIKRVEKGIELLKNAVK